MPALVRRTNGRWWAPSSWPPSFVALCPKMANGKHYKNYMAYSVRYIYILCMDCYTQGYDLFILYAFCILQISLYLCHCKPLSHMCSFSARVARWWWQRWLKPMEDGFAASQRWFFLFLDNSRAYNKRKYFALFIAIPYFHISCWAKHKPFISLGNVMNFDTIRRIQQ